MFYCVWSHSCVKWTFQFGCICTFLWNENKSILKYYGRYTASHTWSNKIHEVKIKLDFNYNMINASIIFDHFCEWDSWLRVRVIHSMCMIWICWSVTIKIHRYEEGCTGQNLEQRIKFCIRTCIVLDFTFGFRIEWKTENCKCVWHLLWPTHRWSQHKYILLKLTYAPVTNFLGKVRPSPVQLWYLRGLMFMRWHSIAGSYAVTLPGAVFATCFCYMVLV